MSCPQCHSISIRTAYAVSKVVQFSLVAQTPECLLVSRTPFPARDSSAAKGPPFHQQHRRATRRCHYKPVASRALVRQASETLLRTHLCNHQRGWGRRCAFLLLLLFLSTPKRCRCTALSPPMYSLSIDDSLNGHVLEQRGGLAYPSRTELAAITHLSAPSTCFTEQ
ncbi:hypothetical protein BR93DRAFT_481161 [Coniochaeta sp. PMI_546]|nr:hypothetical protein BR93DRAFT_481161 [Coniochaeta sp. PMI_546]